jgi:outer membrane protein
MRISRLSRAALLAALAAFPAAAQAPAPRALSLDDALRTARENNPDYQKRLAEVETADADRRQARGAFYPRVTLGFSSSGYSQRTFTGRDEFGRPVAEPLPITIEGSQMRQSLDVGGLTLFDGGGRLRTLRSAEATVAASRAGVEAEELRLRGEVTRRYYAAVRQRQAIALEERLLEVAQAGLEATQRLLRVAVRTPVDVLSAEVKVAEQEQALERARGEARKAELDLRQQMGVFGSEPLALSDAAPAPFDPSELDAEALVAAALSANPRIERVDAGVRAADQRVRAAGAARWPTLSVGAGLSRNQNFTGYRGLVEPTPRDRTLGLDFQFSLPLFNQFRTSSAIAQARAGRTSAQVDARAERIAVERDVRFALVELENAFGAVRAAERTLAISRERRELSDQQYRLGSISFTDLQSAVEDLARAERAAHDARFDFAAALVTLEEKAGGPVALR